MRLYHSTSLDAAAAVESRGFLDSRADFGLVGIASTGVFVSDVPLDENEGARSGACFAIDAPNDVDLAEYELVEEGKPYREWCVRRRC